MLSRLGLQKKQDRRQQARCCLLSLYGAACRLPSAAFSGGRPWPCRQGRAPASCGSTGAFGVTERAERAADATHAKSGLRDKGLQIWLELRRVAVRKLQEWRLCLQVLREELQGT